MDYKFSHRSLTNLSTANHLFKEIFTEVLKYIDITVICGHRSEDEQFELFKKGRKKVDGTWIIHDRAQVVTYVDGKIRKSKHNAFPSLAVDVVPYPIDWEDKEFNEQINYLAGLAIGISHSILKDTNYKLVWGKDWNMDGNFYEHKLIDGPHFELQKKSR